LRKLVERHGTENEGLTQIELIEELDRAKSTISEAVTYLEENDFVVKQSTSGRKPDLIKLKNPGLFMYTESE
jgi:predicted transcriptional regulator